MPKLITLPSLETCDGNFLLEERTGYFLNKLFGEILPIGDTGKINFFYNVLIKIENNYYFHGKYYFIEDIFEGLDEFYKKLNLLFRVNKINPDLQKIILQKSAQIIQNNILHASSFKVLLERFISILELVVARGGNVSEQLEYLSSNSYDHILHNPVAYRKAQNLMLNVIHPKTSLSQNSSDEPKLKKEIIVDIKNQKYESVYDTGSGSYNYLNQAIQYLATIPSHQRPSIETYYKYTHNSFASLLMLNCQSDIPAFPVAEYISFDQPINPITGPWFDSKSFTEKQEFLKNTPKKKVKLPCGPLYSVKTDDANLVANFTNLQAAENNKLLAINILSSIGENYDQDYPDQEFDRYISLLNLWFSENKVYSPIEAGSGEYVITQNYNRNISEATEKFTQNPKDQTVTDKEQNHRAAVEFLVDIYQKNPEFNFAQIIAAGLSNLNKDNPNSNTIKQAKELLKYNNYFTQTLRVLLSTPVQSGQDLNLDINELHARSYAVKTTLSNLFQTPDPNESNTTLHELITQHGIHPENLAFFASVFGKNMNIDKNDLDLFMSKISALDSSIKDEMFQSFVNTQLPYNNGKMVLNNFPSFSLADLDDSSKIKEKITLATQDKIPESTKTIFKDANIHVLEKSLIRFSKIEKQFNIAIPEKIKLKLFAELREDILADKNFIKNNFTKNIQDPDAINKIHVALAEEMFYVFSYKNKYIKEELSDIIAFLFDVNNALESQFLNLEINFHLTSELLDKCSENNKDVRRDFLNNLLMAPKISPVEQHKVLGYLNSIDQDLLQNKKCNLLQLIKSSGNDLIVNNFELFKIVTDSFLDSQSDIDIKELYKSTYSLIYANYNYKNIQKIINYYLVNSNPIIISLLSRVDGASDDINELIDFFTKITPADINKLYELLNSELDQLLSIKEIKKIAILMDIAFKLDRNINRQQYKTLVDKIKIKDLEYAQLVKSYLLAEIKEINCEKVISTVFDHMDNLTEMQFIFSAHNTSRFVYDNNRLNQIIDGVSNKNPEQINQLIDSIANKDTKQSKDRKKFAALSEINKYKITFFSLQ